MSKGHKKQIMQDKILNHANTILRSLSDSRLQFVSITKVELNNDFSMAKLFWDTYDSSKRGETLNSTELIESSSLYLVVTRSGEDNSSISLHVSLELFELSEFATRTLCSP